MTGRLRCGTSSWSEKSWVGSFYPVGTKAGAMLGCYSQQFDTVEADVTYYRVPDRKLVEGWRDRTPPGFLLSAKFPRTIVHGGDAEKPDGARVLVAEHVGADTERFLDAMGRLGDRCGPLVLQFPYFNRQAFPALPPFLDRLDAFLGRLPKSFRYGVEVRNKNWLGPELLAVLRQHRVALVLVDLAYLPHPADLAATMDVLTADFVYARLIGDRKAIDAVTTTFDRIVVDQSASLQRWGKLLAAFLARVPEVFAYANNHFAGHGPATARELIAAVQG